MAPTQTQPTTNLSEYGAYGNQAQNFLKQGYSPQEVQQAFNSQGLGQTNPQAQSQPQSHGNWFERLLPTIGGIGGGILGSLAMPFLGTAAGSGIGGALGQELENSLTGSKGSTMASGLENAAGGLLGDVGGSLLGGVIGKAGDVAANSADKLIAGQAPNGMIAPDVANYIRTGLGTTDLGQAAKIADQVTGDTVKGESQGGAELSQFVKNNFINNAPSSYDLSSFQKLTALPKNQMFADAQSLANGNPIQTAIEGNNLYGTPGAKTLTSRLNGIFGAKDLGSMSSEDVLQAQKDVSSLAHEFYSNPRIAQAQDLGNAANQISNHLKGIMQLDKMPVSPEDLQALSDKVASSVKDINPTAANNIQKEILGLKGADGGDPTVSDIRSFESKFVGIKKALQTASEQAKANFGKSTADLAKSTLPIAGSIVGDGGLKSAAGAGAGLLASHPEADAKIAGVLAKGSDLLGSNIVKKGVPLMTRAAITAAANLPNIASSITPTNGSAILSKLQNEQNNNNQNGGNGMNGNGGQLSPLEQMYTAGMIDPFQFSSLLNTLAPTMQKAQVAQNEMSMLPQLYAQGGGGQGLMGGLLSNIEGLIPGTNQYNYMQARNVAAKAGAPFGITPGFMPSFMQSPMGAQSLFNTNQGLLSGLAS